MANFGFSLGDILLVSNYAYTVYKSCKNAGDAFKSISTDVNSLRSLLLVLNDECANPQSSFQHLQPSQRGELSKCLQDCKSELREVKKVLHDYQSLNTGDPRFRDRLTFTNGRQASLRDSINTHTTRIQRLLSGVNTGTLSRIENNTEVHLLSIQDIRAKLDEIHRDLLAGRRDASALASTDGVVALEDEVLGDDMTEVDVDLSHEVSKWLDKVRPSEPEPYQEIDPRNWESFNQDPSAYEYEAMASSQPWSLHRGVSAPPAMQHSPPIPQPSRSIPSPQRPTNGIRSVSDQPYGRNRLLSPPRLLQSRTIANRNPNTPSLPPPPPPPSRLVNWSSYAPRIPPQQPVIHASPSTDFLDSSNADFFVDVSELEQCVVRSLRSVSVYEPHTGTWSGKKTLDQNSNEERPQAIFIKLNLRKEDFVAGSTKTVLVRRRVREPFQVDRFEENLVKVKVKKQDRPPFEHRALYQGLGNETIHEYADFKVIAIEDVHFYFTRSEKQIPTDRSMSSPLLRLARYI